MDTGLYIGTSGYSYKDWEGVLYPYGTHSEDYLGIYAHEFNVAELNYSYYRMPDPKTGRRMVELVPDSYLFSVKAHRSLTHEFDSGSLQNNCEMFIKGISPFIEENKLASVLLQFPYSFHYTKENRLYLDKLSKHLETVPVCVEFRNDQWLLESVCNELKSRNIGFVNVDEPSIAGLPKQTSILCSDIGYIRFHGRNAQNWWNGDNVNRYDYNYSDRELMEWIPSIDRIMQHARIVLVVFNNHSKGQAVQNARRLKELYKEEHEKQ